MSTPTVAENDRIARLADPVLRNLRITQCYYEISHSLAAVLGSSANWCTFATWASKQAGQTIRQEDLVRAFNERFALSPEVEIVLENIARHLKDLGTNLRIRARRKAILRALDPAAAFARAGDAVARGNKKVFEEIGREFARFLGVFHDDTRFDPDKTARFCAALRAGEPPAGQRLLSETFTTYCKARFETGKEKAELILLANLCAALHEQIRLQPEISEALNAAIDNALEVKRRLLPVLLPDFLINAAAHTLSGHRSRLDALIARLTDEANRLIRKVITDHLMTLRLSDTEVLHLGRDLEETFPAALAEIRNPRLREMLDATPDGVKGSGAEDWADLTDRIHYIANFFRIYQERRYLFDAPFTLRQVELLKTGVRPEGRL